MFCQTPRYCYPCVTRYCKHVVRFEKCYESFDDEVRGLFDELIELRRKVMEYNGKKARQKHSRVKRKSRKNRKRK